MYQGNFPLVVLKQLFVNVNLYGQAKVSEFSRYRLKCLENSSSLIPWDAPFIIWKMGIVICILGLII